MSSFHAPLALLARQAWGRSPPFQPLASPSATRRPGAECGPSKQNPALPCWPGLALARCSVSSSGALLSRDTATFTHASVTVATCIPGTWGSTAGRWRLLSTRTTERRGGEKVQARDSPAESPDCSHRQHILPTRQLGRWRPWCQTEELRSEDNPCSLWLSCTAISSLLPSCSPFHGVEEQTSTTSTTNTDTSTAVAPRGQRRSPRGPCCPGPGPVSVHRGAACLCWSEASSRPQRHSKQPA